MNKNEIIQILGKTGEKIIANMLMSEGKKVEFSIDEYDREKDLVVDGKKVEVKTEQPFVVKNALTFGENQLRKCRSVDRLFFVTVPPLMREEYKWGNCIFEVDPKNFEHYLYTTKDGKRKVCISIEQESVKFIRKLTKEESDNLSKYRVSDYKK